MPRLPDFTALGQAPSGVTRRSTVTPTNPVPEAQAQFGNELMRAGNVIADTNRRWDTVAAEDAYNQLQMKSDALQFDPETGFRNKLGKDAMGADFFKTQVDRFDEAQSAIEEGLKNDDQKTLFKHRSAIARENYTKALLTHRAQQATAYAAATEQTTLDTELANVTHEPHDDQQFEASMARIDKTIEDSAARQGMDSKWVKAKKAEQFDKLTAARVMTLVDTDPTTAKKIYDGAAKKLSDPAIKARLEAMVKAGGIKQQSQAAADEIMGMNLTEQKAKEYARTKYKDNPEVRDELVRRLDVRYADERQALDRSQKEADDQAYQIVGQGGSFDDVPQSLKAQMDGESLGALRDYAEKRDTGYGPKDDPATFNELSDMMASDPAKFAGLNLMPYVNKLTPHSWEAFKTTQAALNSGDQKTQILLNSVNKAMTYAKLQLNAVGVKTSGIKPDTPAADRLAKFQALLQEEISTIIEDKKRGPTSQEITSIVNGLLTKGTVPGHWWGRNEALMFDIYGQPDFNQFRVPIENIPEEDRKKAEAVANQMGYYATDDVIERVYTELLLLKMKEGK